MTEYQKKLLPLKTGQYLIIDKPTETTYILKDNNKEQITIHRNHIVPYYPKEKRTKIELQNYLLTNEILTLKQPNVATGTTGTKQNPILRNLNWTSSVCTYINTISLSLNRKGTVITYVDDIFIQTNSYPQMYETLIEYHKILLKENLKPAPDKTYFM